MVENGELVLEQRVKMLEQVLYKKGTEEREWLFEHIYEKIKCTEKCLSIEI